MEFNEPKEPKCLKSEIVDTWEDPQDKPVYFEAPESGSDTRKHKWQARYRYTKMKEIFDDGTTRERVRSELLPGTLLDLGAIEVEQTHKDEATKLPPKSNLVKFPRAS